MHYVSAGRWLARTFSPMLHSRVRDVDENRREIVKLFNRRPMKPCGLCACFTDAVLYMVVVGLYYLPNVDRRNLQTHVWTHKSRDTQSHTHIWVYFIYVNLFNSIITRWGPPLMVKIPRIIEREIERERETV